MGETNLKDALQAYLKNSPFRKKMIDFRLKDLWEKEMGETIAKYTRSIKLFNRQLIITTDIAPLKQELSFSKEKIQKRMNEGLGEKLIDKVIIR